MDLTRIEQFQVFFCCCYFFFKNHYVSILKHGWPQAADIAEQINSLICMSFQMFVCFFVCLHCLFTGFSLNRIRDWMEKTTKMVTINKGNTKICVCNCNCTRWKSLFFFSRINMRVNWMQMKNKCDFPFEWKRKKELHFDFVDCYLNRL